MSACDPEEIDMDKFLCFNCHKRRQDPPPALECLNCEDDDAALLCAECHAGPAPVHAVTWRCDRGHVLEPEDDDDDPDVFECDNCKATSRKIALCCPRRCDFGVCKTCARSARPPSYARTPHLIFTAHGDSNFTTTRNTAVPDTHGHLRFAHADNFAGVRAMMEALWSGELPEERIRIAITDGEEGDDPHTGESFRGARDVALGLEGSDVAVIIDVTNTERRHVGREAITDAYVDQVLADPTRRGMITIEKLGSNPVMETLLNLAWGPPATIEGRPNPAYAAHAGDEARRDPGFDWHCFLGCPDEVATEDESDAFREEGISNAVFLGVPTASGEIGRFRTDGDYNDGPVFVWMQDIEAVTRAVILLSKTFVDRYSAMIGQ